MSGGSAARRSPRPDRSPTVRFAGETPIKSRLEAGPVEVVNLIGARAAVRIDLKVVGAGDSLTVGAGTHIVYACDEAAALEIDGKEHRLAADHALHIAASGPTMIACRGGVFLLGSVICV